MSTLEFTEDRLERYSRHILLKDVGIEGQQKLFDAKVLIIGAGGLGSPIALYLAAAGVGTLGIADADVVDVSNLQRQVIHFTRDLGRAKVESAAEKMRAINPDVTVRTYHEFLLAANIRPILRDYDFVIDGTDNFAAKFLINDACVLEGIPFSHGGILRFNGQTMTVIPGQSACYRCVFHAPPPRGSVPTCSQAGVLGAVAGMLGTIQAVEALKFITGAGTLLTDTLLSFDAKTLDFRKARFKRNPRCPICGENPTIHTLIDEEQPVCDLKAEPASAS
jgi:molybdopterin/thiamine biosynthesis adenylyltransferase